MSQNGANWLAKNGRTHEAILRYFYGADLEIGAISPPAPDPPRPQPPFPQPPPQPPQPPAQKPEPIRQPAQNASPKSDSSPIGVLAALTVAIIGDITR